MIRLANSPSSWRAPEFGLDGNSPDYRQVLSEMEETGYRGTELGHWNFLPNKAFELRESLKEFGLQLPGAFVPVALSVPGEFEKGIEKVVNAAALMYNAGFEDSFIVLADEAGSVEERTIHAGRITANMALPEEDWVNFAGRAEKVASEVRRQFGLRTVFHNHCGSYVETPDEVARLMELTDPSLLGLCLDTGHYAFGGGDPVEGLKQFYERIWHIHLKDLNPRIDEEAAKNNYDYFKSVEEGLFCELGKGSVDFKSIIQTLNEKDYDGWIVVEQPIIQGMGSPKNHALNNRKYLRNLGI